MFDIFFIKLSLEAESFQTCLFILPTSSCQKFSSEVYESTPSSAVNCSVCFNPHLKEEYIHKYKYSVVELYFSMTVTNTYEAMDYGHPMSLLFSNIPNVLTDLLNWF